MRMGAPRLQVPALGSKAYNRGVNGPPTEIQVRPPGPKRGQALAPRLFLVLYVASIASVIYLFRPYITDLILSLLLVALTQRQYRQLTVRLGHRRWLASFIVTTLIVVVVLVPTSFVATSLSREAANVYEDTRASFSLAKVESFLMGESWTARNIRSAGEAFGYQFSEENLREALTQAASRVAAFLYAQVNLVLTNVLSAVLHFFIIVVTVFYLFVDGPRLKAWIFRLSPLPEEQEEVIAEKFGAVGRAILVGNGIGSILQGVLGGLAMWTVGLPSPVLWGTVMAVFAFLPVVGISMVVIPATAYLLLVDRFGAALFFFCFCGIQALVMENAVKTRLIGTSIQTHDLVIFMSIVGGLGAFGILGLLYGPLLVTLFLTLCELFEADYKDRLVKPQRRSVGSSHSHSIVAGGFDETS
jgi:predicted PurR-regulated permease PerM